MDSAIDSAKSAKSSLKFRTVEEIDAEIRKLETTQVGGAGRQTDLKTRRVGVLIVWWGMGLSSNLEH